MHKIICSLRTLWSWSSSRPSRISFNALRSLPRWVLSRYILILTLGLSFFFLLFPLPSSPVLRASAQEPSVTPITFVPLFPSSTPEPTKDLTCPGVQPSGYGTLTPDPYWLLNCSPCLTNVPHSTASPFPVSTFMIPLTQTAQAGITPTITATQTVTAIPTSAVGLSCATSAGGTCSQINSNTVGGTFNHVSNGTSKASYLGINPVPSGTPLYVRFSMINMIYDNYYIQRNWSGYISYSNTGPATLEINPNNIPLLVGHNSLLLYNKQYVINPSNASLGTTYYVYLTHSGIQGTYTQDVTYTVYVSTDGFYSDATPTPTPTVTPTPSGYCSSIVGTDALGIDSEFALPVPVLGAKTCPVNYGGNDVPLFGLFGLPDVHIPSIQVCFQDITFGILKYYGMDIDVDYLAYILAAAVIVSMFTRGR